MELGEKLRKLIKERYPSIGDFADKHDINYTQLSQYLNGRKWSFDFLMMVIEEFNELDLNWLLRDQTKTKNGLSEPSKSYKKSMSNEEIVDEISGLLSHLKSQLPQK